MTIKEKVNMPKLKSKPKKEKKYSCKFYIKETGAVYYKKNDEWKNYNIMPDNPTDVLLNEYQGDITEKEIEEELAMWREQSSHKGRIHEFYLEKFLETKIQELANRIHDLEHKFNF